MQSHFGIIDETLHHSNKKQLYYPQLTVNIMKTITLIIPVLLNNLVLSQGMS
jgi:hypothetical protein